MLFDRELVTIRSHCSEDCDAVAQELVFVPPGTPDNSPPFQRWVSRVRTKQVPSGTTDPPNGSRQPLVKRIYQEKSLSPPWGLAFESFRIPPINRWAIIGCPQGTIRPTRRRLQSLVARLLGGLKNSNVARPPSQSRLRHHETRLSSINQTKFS